ncbi:glucuronate isomerase [Paenibacillus paeoniae]|uniref:Uronate isomerase n=1 Tax=Paenibacillus paeoniae TaxID=2292705 RepID=A0A371PEZ6_9BACL|nr:glucuronate isomerase [Paenibacillus paeoniae]REK74475.1 glucuronate isomerase [Paenibacillus paeoniae]
MTAFIQDDFLLQSEIAKKLYHDYAKHLPIIDYHCHLDPKAIAENQRFRNITDIWLGGDHYKWRALRTYGIDEQYITGNASDEEKFEKWSEVLPFTIGNPLFHWSALELKTYFGVESLLSHDNWQDIYQQCNEAISQPDFTTQELITRSNVKWICTTDDPIDDLRYHKQIAEQTAFKTHVTPTFRPDKALQIGASSFLDYVKQLEQVVGYEIVSYDDIEKALLDRAEYFASCGCFISDHGFSTLPYAESTPAQLEMLFAKRLDGAELSKEECDQYTTSLFLALGRKYANLGWAMQLHIGAIRNPNTRRFKELGPDTGFDTIGDITYADALCQLLDALEQTSELPKTILYNLNAVQNDVLAAMIGSFQQSGIRGKVQFGSGWWYNDQKEGMTKQITALSNLGLLSCFVGMLTDSRSFLSYTRHEYFRRILCNILGGWAQCGEVPDDLPFLGRIVEDICYNNANAYFELDARKVK